MVSPNLQRTSQSLEPGDRIDLYVLDLAPLGENFQVYFTSAISEDGNRIRFRGADFASVEVKADGFEYNGTGAFPQPKLSINNAQKFLSGLTINYQDLIGAQITRFRTYKQFLDGQPTADPEAVYEPDIYFVEQKTKHNKSMIEWALSSSADQQGVTLPRRKMYRDTCTHSYRLARKGGGFDYSKATCPYSEARYFDKEGKPTDDPSKDMCGLLLSHCRKRFVEGSPSGGVLQFRAFPGLIRTTVS